MKPTAGRIAYEAYCAAAGERSLISGDKLPDYADLQPGIAAAWERAATSVIEADRAMRADQ